MDYSMVDGVASLPSGVEIAYSTFGPSSAPPLLLVMGLGGPSIWWHDELCRDLVDRGFHVIRYDNRDVGWSTAIKDQWVHRRQVVRAFMGRPVPGAYTMADLAEDAFGLLDHLGIEAAHITGVSMGGMIAQTMAVTHPDRVLSLVSIMSSTGRRTVGWQHPALLPMLLRRSVNTREAYIRQSARVWDAIGSPGYPEDPEEGPPRRRDLGPRRQPDRHAAPDAGGPHPARPEPRAAQAADPGPGDPRQGGQDGAPLRGPRHRPRHPRRRAAAGARHGARPAAGPAPAVRRRHHAYGVARRHRPPRREPAAVRQLSTVLSR
jgi:pimeloyl-ACP methyl ester carboxylesterase